MRNSKCADCYELIFNGYEGAVCDRTRQPIFMMPNCPMEDNTIPCELDPCYTWFPTSKFAITYCKTVAFGKPCQFKLGEECNCGYYYGLIRNMRYCPLLRYDIHTGKKLKPRENYDIIRIPDYILKGVK